MSSNSDYNTKMMRMVKNDDISFADDSNKFNSNNLDDKKTIWGMLTILILRRLYGTC